MSYEKKECPIRLSDSQWKPILEYLRTRSDLYVGKEEKCRLFVEAILWMARSGAQWRLLPASYGEWNTVYRRFADWSNKGIWKGLFEFIAVDPDLEFIMIDSTSVRAHACSCGYKKGIRKPSVGVEAG